MNISMNIPMHEATMKPIVKTGKSAVQSITSKQPGSFGDVFSQINKQSTALPKAEVSDKPSLLEVLSFTEKEEIADFLLHFMSEEDVEELLEIVENVPFMYQLEDVVKHLLETVPVLKEWVVQHVTNQPTEDQKIQSLSNRKGQVQVEREELDKVLAITKEGPKNLIDQFMMQITQLFDEESTLTEDQLSVFAALQAIIQEVLTKSDQTFKEVNWLHQLQNIREQKSVAPTILLQAVQGDMTEEVAQEKSTLASMAIGQVADFARQGQSQLLAQAQQSAHPVNNQPSQTLQAILQQMTTESNETSQTKVEGVSSTGLTSKDAASEAITQRFQLNLEQTPEAKRGEKLMQELQAMMKRANFGRAGGVNRITVQVYPEQLGQIRIELQENKGILTARILASVAMTKDLLERQMNQLRQALGQHTQVERIEIVQMLQETPRHEREQLFQQQQRQFQQQQSKKENKEDDEQTFEEFLAQLEEVELDE